MTRPSPLSDLRRKLFECVRLIHADVMPTNAAEEPVSSNPRMRFVNIWADIVTRYSTCALTMPDDKIPALLGIANRIQAMAKVPHHFGVFFDDSPLVLRSLLWYRQNSYLRRPNLARAPSWSWASCDGSVAFQYGPLDNNDTKIRDLNNITGSEQYGNLSPIAKLLNTLEVSHDRSTNLGPILISSPLVETTRDTSPSSESSRGRLYHRWPSGSFACHAAGSPEPYGHGSQVLFDSETYQPLEFLCMPLFSRHGDPMIAIYRSLTYRFCLVLQSDGDGPIGCEYRRIGIAVLTSVYKDTQLPEKKPVVLT